MGLSWWLIAIVDASVARSSYAVKPDKVRSAWLQCAERSRWFSRVVPDPRTWIDARLRTQADGSKMVRERRA